MLRAPPDRGARDRGAAAGGASYTLREIMEYVGHSSPAATERYVELLPKPEERGPADRLDDDVARAAGR